VPISYKVDDSAGIVVEKWIGDITSQVLKDHWRSLTSDPVAMACKGALADISGCSLRFSSEELDQLIRSIVRPGIGGRPWKSAVVVAQLVQHGVARQYGALTDSKNEIEIFTDSALAREWLQI
jgi:hypothetical protein